MEDGSWEMEECNAAIKCDLLNWFSTKPSFKCRTGETVKMNFISGLNSVNLVWMLLREVIISSTVNNSFVKLLCGILLHYSFIRRYKRHYGYWRHQRPNIERLCLWWNLLSTDVWRQEWCVWKQNYYLLYYQWNRISKRWCSTLHGQSNTYSIESNTGTA